MKKLILAVLMIVPMGLAAQTLTLSQIIEKYDGQEGYTIVDMGPEMLSQASELAGGGMDAETKAQVDDAVKGLKSMRVLTTENASDEIIADIEAFIAEGDYEPMISVSEEEGKVRILTSKENGDEETDKEMLIVVMEDKELVVVQMIGEMDAAEMMKYINIGE